MENITLGQVSIAVTFIVGLISGTAFLSQNVKKWIRDAMNEQMTELTRRLDQVDMESTKNFLVAYLSDVENGKMPGEIEKQRFYEEYQHYEKIGGNSYIKHKVDELKAKNWL